MNNWTVKVPFWSLNAPLMTKSRRSVILLSLLAAVLLLQVTSHRQGFGVELASLQAMGASTPLGVGELCGDLTDDQLVDILDVILLQRDNPGDREQAISLLDESLTISTELGMRPLKERVISRQNGLNA